jgi:cytochrome bd-type quinol oxidase subunit 2
MFKKIILSLFIIALLLTPTMSFALDLGIGSYVKKAGSEAGFNPDTNDTTLSQNIGLIINIVLSISGVLFTVLMVYGGYLWMIARGEEAQIDKSKEIIRAAVIGLIIVLAAYSITAFIVPRILAGTTPQSTTSGENLPE